MKERKKRCGGRCADVAKSKIQGERGKGMDGREGLNVLARG